MKKSFDPAAYPIAAFDLDGTLLHMGLMSDGVRSSLIALKAAGVVPVIASGRDAAQLSPELLELFDYAVLANGSYITEIGTGRSFCVHPLQPELIQNTIRTVRKNKGGLYLFMNGEMWGTVRALAIRLSRVPLRILLSGKKTYSHNSSVYPRLERKIAGAGREGYKMQCFFRDQPDCERAARDMAAFTQAEVLTMTDATLEVTMRGVSKALSLDALARKLGTDVSHIAAFGDSVNDVEMLRSCGYAVAMANGDDCVKAIADYIAPDVRQDGAAQAIYELYRIKSD